MLFSLFENVLDKYTPEPRQIILAFSGGVDSRVMLDLLATYRDIRPHHQYLVVHIHHGLSPHADSWLAQCERWAKDADFAFKGIRVSLEKKGEGLESAAREARYKAILALAKEGALILTAQHADDQAETFLLALKRGSGPTGLSAMPETRVMEHIVLCRPLLGASRKAIEGFAESQGLNWIEDESNRDNRFDRNFIRNEWLPMATERWPSMVSAINRTAAHCAVQESLLSELLLQYDVKVMGVDGSFDITVARGYSLQLQMALVRRWLKKVGGLALSTAQLEQVFISVIDAGPDANPMLKLSSGEVRRFDRKLWFVRPYTDVTSWTSSLVLNRSVQLPDNIGTLTLSLRERAKSQVRLRQPKPVESVSIGFNPEGVLAHPAGRQGKRKLKKLFQEYGVPSWLRRRTPILFYGDAVVAVADLFVCEEYVGDECELVWHKCRTLNA